MSSRHWRQPIGRGDSRTRAKSTCRRLADEDADKLSGFNLMLDNDNDPNIDNDNDPNIDNDNDPNIEEIDWSQFAATIFQLERDEPSRQSYMPLLLHDTWVDENTLDPRWQPLGNMVHWFLLLGWFSRKYNFTREQMKWILNMLNTLQYYKLIDESLYIPTDPSTISKWKRYFPTPPVGK